MVAERSFLLWGVLKFSDRNTYTNVAEKGQEKFLVPKIFSEAKELVNKLSIEDLRTFCCTLALAHDGSKASLKDDFSNTTEDSLQR